MPQWISLNNAAWKYGVTEEDVRFWAEQREIASVHTGAVYIVDDESIQEFLCQFRIPPTKEVLVTQKQIYENQEVICELYAEIIEQKEREVASLKEKITRM